MTNEEAIKVIQGMELNEFDNPVLCEEAISMAVQALKNSGGWISVRDRMPPSNDLVIVSINDDRGDNDYRYTNIGWYLSDGNCWIVDNEATINVEAWKPLPKPYMLPKGEK